MSAGLKQNSAFQHFDVLDLKLGSITHFQRIFSLACHRCSIDCTWPNVFLNPLPPPARSIAGVYHDNPRNRTTAPQSHTKPAPNQLRYQEIAARLM
jgi:hypothetical protein